MLLHPWLMLSAFASTELSWVLLAGINRLTYFSINIAVGSLLLFGAFRLFEPHSCRHWGKYFGRKFNIVITSLPVAVEL